jgi:hypothetical protein
MYEKHLKSLENLFKNKNLSEDLKKIIDIEYDMVDKFDKAKVFLDGNGNLKPDAINELYNSREKTSIKREDIDSNILTPVFKYSEERKNFEDNGEKKDKDKKDIEFMTTALLSLFKMCMSYLGFFQRLDIIALFFQNETPQNLFKNLNDSFLSEVKYWKSLVKDKFDKKTIKESHYKELNDGIVSCITLLEINERFCEKMAKTLSDQRNKLQPSESSIERFLNVAKQRIRNLQNSDINLDNMGVLHVIGAVAIGIIALGSLAAAIVASSYYVATFCFVILVGAVFYTGDQLHKEMILEAEKLKLSIKYCSAYITLCQDNNENITKLLKDLNALGNIQATISAKHNQQGEEKKLIEKIERLIKKIQGFTDCLKDVEDDDKILILGYLTLAGQDLEKKEIADAKVKYEKAYKKLNDMSVKYQEACYKATFFAPKKKKKIKEDLEHGNERRYAPA